MSIWEVVVGCFKALLSQQYLRTTVGKMGTEMVLETSVLYRHLTRLISREDFIEFSRRGNSRLYEGVSKSFRTGRLERELQMLQLCVAKCSCIAILWVRLVGFPVKTLCVASQRVFIVVYFVTTQSENFWIYPRILTAPLYHVFWAAFE
jgi:hypothetical protein